MLTLTLQIKDIKVEHTRLSKIRDNNWVTPEPTKTKKTPKKGMEFKVYITTSLNSTFKLVVTSMKS